MTPEEAFQDALGHWKERMFTDTPQGRSLFAFGAAYVLTRLRDEPDLEAWEEVRDEMAEFAAAFMAESDRRANDPARAKALEAMAQWNKLRDANPSD